MSAIFVAFFRLISSVIITCIIAVTVIAIKFIDDNSLDCDDVINFVRELKSIR